MMARDADALAGSQWPKRARWAAPQEAVAP